MKEYGNEMKYVTTTETLGEGTANRLRRLLRQNFVDAAEQYDFPFSARPEYKQTVEQYLEPTDEDGNVVDVSDSVFLPSGVTNKWHGRYVHTCSWYYMQEDSDG